MKIRVDSRRTWNINIKITLGQIRRWSTRDKNELAIRENRFTFSKERTLFGVWPTVYAGIQEDDERTGWTYSCVATRINLQQPRVIEERLRELPFTVYLIASFYFLQFLLSFLSSSFTLCLHSSREVCTLVKKSIIQPDRFYETRSNLRLRLRFDASN